MSKTSKGIVGFCLIGCVVVSGIFILGIYNRDVGDQIDAVADQLVQSIKPAQNVKQENDVPVVETPVEQPADDGSKVQQNAEKTSRNKPTGPQAKGKLTPAC